MADKTDWAFPAELQPTQGEFGFDLPKLVCGAYGTLCVLTELTFRVFPKPPFAAILCLPDVSPEVGFGLLRKIAHSPLEPAGLAYLPAAMMPGPAPVTTIHPRSAMASPNCRASS